MEKRSQENYRRVRGSYGSSRSVETVTKEPSTRLRRTLDAMRRGVEVICRGYLESHDGRFFSYPDFLVRVDDPESDFGPWSYEVVDAQMALHDATPALMQLFICSELLTDVQGRAPHFMRLAIGDSNTNLRSFRFRQNAAYFNSIRSRLIEHVNASPITHPRPVRHCDSCRWLPQCKTTWRHFDDLYFVPTITTVQRRQLMSAGIRTARHFAALPSDHAVPNLPALEFRALQRQAQARIRGNKLTRSSYELVRDISADVGLCALPEPNAGDLFLETKGTFLRIGCAIEYLFGMVDRHGTYKQFVVLDSLDERRTFERVVDILSAQWEKHPRYHVYVAGFGQRPVSALKRLMAKYATREVELESLIRADIFVDLFQVVRDAIVAPIQRYSLYDLAPVVGHHPRHSRNDVQAAAVVVEAALQYGEERRSPKTFDFAMGRLQESTEGACRFLVRLANWLEACRSELESQLERELSRPSQPTLKAMPRNAVEIRRMRGQLVGEPSDSCTMLSRHQSARSILAHLLGFFRREAVFGADVAVSVLEGSIRRVVAEVISSGFVRHCAATDLLLRRPPRSVRQPPLASAAICDTGTPPKSSARSVSQAVAELDHSVLAVQGPPGSGKTRVGAETILDLLASGRKVGITANTHIAISNLLHDVFRVAKFREDQRDDTGVNIRAIQKTFAASATCRDDRVEKTSDYYDVSRSLKAGKANLAAGTAWLWAQENMKLSVDVLVADEAGQMSLAHLLAASQGAKSLFLLGDPRQLPPPIEDAHPREVAISGLNYMLGDANSVEASYSVNLENRTWRLNPTICNFVSTVYYEGQLKPRPGMGHQAVVGPSVLAGHGLRFVPVLHNGRTTSSEEEMRRVKELLLDLFSGDNYWIDRAGCKRGITPQDVLVVAAYVDQADLMRHHFPKDVRVATVDKCQGLNTAIVIYSMATSSPDDVWPVQTEFLFSRLNAAVSSARCVAAVVANPQLLEPACQTENQIRVAAAFCRFVEIARIVK